jgi:molybdenum cofactor cytidylyltransferase
MKRMTAGRVVGIILAAGASTRMGRPKQLIQVGDGSLIGHIIREADKSKLDHVVLVLGARAKEIKDSLATNLDNPRIKIVENSKWEKGISSSIIAGLKEVEDEYDHCMIILGDMPHVTSTLINRLLSEYLMSGMDLGAIMTGKGRSLPAIFSRPLYPELLNLKGDIGARNVFKKYPGRVCLVNPEDDYDDMDIDTPYDYSLYKNDIKNITRNNDRD